MTLAETVLRAYTIDPERETIREVVGRMKSHLSVDQARKLADVMAEVMVGDAAGTPWSETVAAFIADKTVEGLSEQSLRYYKGELTRFFERVDMPAADVTAETVRRYLADAKMRGCSNVTVDNTRRVLSTFFNHLEDEEMISRSPMRRVKPLKVQKTDKKPYSDVELVRIKEACDNVRDRAIVELLDSSGMRVGELVGLDKADMDIRGMRCQVLGKGGKSRECYFSDVCAMYLTEYLDSRKDRGAALFVSKCSPYDRVSKSSVEVVIRGLGEKAGVPNAHPHRFRRTMATRNLRRGMPVETIQRLLGHSKIETTMLYAMADKSNIEHEARMLMG